MARDICMTCECEIGCSCMCDEPASPTDTINRLRAELAAKDALLAAARGLISDQIESESEFQTEWDQSARTFLAKLKEQE